MAETILEYTYAGDPNFAVNYNLGYIDRSHVQVRINQAVDGGGDPVYANFVWIDASNITITDPLVNGDEIAIIRTVPKDALAVEFAKGDDVTPLNLDKQALQGLMTYEELLDGRVGESSPKLDADRAEAARDAAIASENAAAASASAAATSAGEADQSATDAAISRNEAADERVLAREARDAARLAEDGAEAARDAAAISETNAATSEANAATSETNAATSETNADTSEDNAAISEANAANSAAAAASTANAAEWVSGGSYTEIVDNVVSAITFQTYRAKTTHTGLTTDPSLDTVNWQQLGGSGAITIGPVFPTAPPPSDGDMHYKSAGSTGLYIYYDDGDTSQWVMAQGSAIAHAGPYFAEFHDPTNAGNWRIHGEYLECWGYVISDGTGTANITFPKTFAHQPVAVVSAAASGAVRSDQVISVATGSMVAFSVDGAGSGISSTIGWHAFGKWDGVS